MKKQRIGAGVVVGVLLSACSAAPIKVEKVDYHPAYQYEPGGEIRTEGSLWSDYQSTALFFQDTKASRVGDTVTVKIIESAKASKDAKTKTGRSSKLEAKASTGVIASLPALGAEFANSADGSGSTSRSGDFTADLTAVVTAVFPNGNMAIEGQREVSINNEKEYISLSGVIRPVDIKSKNTVLSSAIADARIEYSGRGNLSDKQRSGWLIRIIDFVWPF